MLPRRLTTKPRGLLRDATLIVALFLFEPNLPLTTLGGVLFGFGAVLHFWSKGALVRNWTVTAVGPYRLVRHPFYLANLLIDIGICFFSGQWWLPAVYFAAFAMVYWPTIKKEEAYLVERHGESYRRYAATVPALAPYRLLAIFGPIDFEWTNILREKEVSRILRVLAIPTYFLIVGAFFHQAPVLSHQRTILLYVSIATALLLNVASALIRKQERQARNTYISDHN